MKLKSKQLQQKENENWSDIKCQMDKSISETKRKKIVNKIEEWRKKKKFNHATAASRTCNVADTHHAEPHRLICALWPLIVSSTKGRKGRETGAASTTCLAAPSSLCLPHSASDQTCYICVLYIDRHKHGGKTATFKCNLRQRLNNFRLSNADWLPRERDSQWKEMDKESTLGSCARHVASFSPGLASIVC